MQACQNGHLESVQALQAKGADLNLLNHEGRSALILAAKNGHTDTCEFLAIFGANTN
jgi:ankyrin repeat protein